MKGFYHIFILVSINTFVQCFIPNLIVKKFDKTLIARKRQDTMDMCRIFTEESHKMNHDHAPKIIKSYRPSTKYDRRYNKGADIKNPFHHERIEKRRYKRDTVTLNEEEAMNKENNNRFEREEMKFEVNPVLNADDNRRVERIVDKLYDDLEEKGQIVTYRRQNVQTTISVEAVRNKSLPSRRFDFAPAFMTGPNVTTLNKIHPEDNGFVSKARWKHGIIPYFIDPKTYDAHLTEVIMKAFDYFEKATCIRLQKLREKPTDVKSMRDVAWVYITNPTGIRQCVHSNERRKIDGVQMIVFGYDCMFLGDIAHEVMHILGYSHEHLRSDRDQHISILWDNIKPGYKKYFDLNVIGTGYELESLPYDYTSILHYPPRAFSKNGKATILTEPGINVGQREGLSEIDVEKVTLIYSNECASRNKEYLLQTCPSVVKSVTTPENITQKDIEEYFQNRLWPFGIINYKLRDKMEFSSEERENMYAVFRHIEQETCLKFRDTTSSERNDDSNADGESKDSMIANSSETEATKQLSYATNENNESEILIPKNTTEGEVKHPNIVITVSKNTKDNEISMDDDNKNESNVKLSINGNDIANMNLTMKRALLRKAKAKKLRRRRRYPRETSARRHAKAMLVLKRSAAPGCQCPEPGKPDGEQVLEISADCFNSVNDLLHFFVHVLGLDHQHNSHDRDNYLHIVWANLTPDVRNEMETKNLPAASAGFPYDYQSVTHYPWLQIKNGKTNIMYPIWNDGWAMGHWQGLSSVDVQKLNLLYFSQCTERKKQEKQF